MHQVQASAAVEQQRIKLDIVANAAAGTCFGTSSNAVSTHQDLIPEPISRRSKRISQNREQQRPSV